MEKTLKENLGEPNVKYYKPKMLGGPHDEEQPPNSLDDLQTHLFEFFGIRQPGQHPNGGNNDNVQHDIKPMDVDDWGFMA